VRNFENKLTEELAAAFQEEEEGLEEVEDSSFDDAQKDRYMTFGIAGQNYGIEILNVTEIVGLQTIAEVPDVPHYVKGMINLRGNVVPVVDVRLRFGMEEREYDDRTCVIVVNCEGSTVGMIVDFVNEVAVFSEDHISPAPKKGEHSLSSEYISGMGKQGEKVTILLDINRLLHGEKALV
jgi:purine-binding chemotaxis protein CheW